MKHHSETHNRRSLRLQGYDYSQDGLYFITICVKDRECLLGKIVHDEMFLSSVGEIANQYWLDIPKHFSHVVLHENVIMPNHIHGIIELTESVGTSHGMSLHDVSIIDTTIKNDTPLNQSIDREFGKPISGSVSTIINQYKSSVQRWCNKNNFRNFQWQSRFFDHIIRSEEDCIRISDYIVNNPTNWKEDNLFQK